LSDGCTIHDILWLLSDCSPCPLLGQSGSFYLAPLTSAMFLLDVSFVLFVD
jgi:hypothetical protein